MKASRCSCLVLISLLTLPCGLVAGEYTFGDLSLHAQLTGSAPIPSVPQPKPQQQADAQQYIPPNNNEPGFGWQSSHEKSDLYLEPVSYIRISSAPVYIKINTSAAEQLPDNTGKCQLAANTIHNLYAAPAFEAQHLIVTLLNPPAGCTIRRGYIYLPDVHSTSAGGLWQLPINVRAFLDTLAYAEGTNEHYNYIYTFVAFSSYLAHPRKRVCSDGLCSTAAGRYQFLSKTWDILSKDLALPNFTPPNQDKAAIELIRRVGAYKEVEKATVYKNFEKAMIKANPIWASLPGSPYGQPTRSMQELWAVYTAAVASYSKPVSFQLPPTPTVSDFECIRPRF